MSSNTVTASHVPIVNSGCKGCRLPYVDPMELDFAFQPIVDTDARTVYACEALVRGPKGEPASYVLSSIDERNRYQFDQLCRTTAIQQAATLGMESLLSINFMPNAVYRPEACIRSTFAAAHEHSFPIDRIIFETVEGENITDRAHLVKTFKACRDLGFKTAIDDFGAGYSGLTLLADFQPDFVKLDMGLVRNVDADTVRQTIVRSVVSMCSELGTHVIAEGVETRGERDFFTAYGVTLMQGYFFAEPGFKHIPKLNMESFGNGCEAESESA